MMKKLFLMASVALCLATIPASAQERSVLLAQTQAAAALADQYLPGQWSALTPSKTTTVYLKLNGSPSKNADGSLSFSGRMWSEGRINDRGADLKSARLDANGKLSIAYPAGSGMLTYDGKLLVGNITYDGIPVNGLQFTKQ